MQRAAFAVLLVLVCCAGAEQLSPQNHSSTQVYDAPDTCAKAFPIQGPFITPVSVFGTLTGNVTEDRQPCDMASISVGDWYIIYPTPGAEVTVTTCRDHVGFDTLLAVLVGSGCGDLRCVSFSDDNCSTYAALSTDTFSAKTAFYYIYVTGYITDFGTYRLTISEIIQ